MGTKPIQPGYPIKVIIFILPCVGSRFWGPFAVMCLPHKTLLWSDTFIAQAEFISKHGYEIVVVLNGETHITNRVTLVPYIYIRYC